MHPAARKTVERVLGIEWSYHLLDFNTQLGVAARLADGRSLAVRAELPKPFEGFWSGSAVLAERRYPDLVSSAKEMILKKLTKETAQCTSPTT